MRTNCQIDCIQNKNLVYFHENAPSRMVELPLSSVSVFHNFEVEVLCVGREGGNHTMFWILLFGGWEVR